MYNLPTLAKDLPTLAKDLPIIAKAKKSGSGVVREYFDPRLRRSREGNLNAFRQISEMLISWLVTGNGRGYYHMAGFWRPGVIFKDKYGHWNKRRYDRQLRSLNPLGHRKWK